MNQPTSTLNNAVQDQTSTIGRDHVADQSHLRHQIEHAAHLLPSQGPITVFVHHNTIHAFEDLQFDEGVQKGGRIYGCNPYLTEERYRQEAANGRIRIEDISAALLDDLGDNADRLVGFLGTRFHLRQAMLQHTLRQAPSSELQWLMAESDALHRYRDDVPTTERIRAISETRHWVMRDLRTYRNGRSTGDGRDRRIRETVAELFELFGKSTTELWDQATWESYCLHLLWQVCQEGVQDIPSFTPPRPLPIRHRSLLQEAVGDDSDLLVHDFLIRYCATFLDQGFANWRLPKRDQGFYEAFSELYCQSGGPPDAWLRGLSDELNRLRDQGAGPLDSIDESLQLLGVHDDERDEFICATLLALRGWAGMIWQMETNAEWTVRPAPPGTMIGYLAVQLILERLALAHVANRSLGFKGPLCELRDTVRQRISRHEAVSVDQRAFLVFQLAQVMGWKAEDLYRLPKQQWSLLVQEVESFSSMERRRIFHAAYERRYRNQALDAIAIRSRWQPPAEVKSTALPGAPAANAATPRTPSFQIVTCIDDREESFRRHLEEVAPDCETLAAAGFFAVAMYYRGAADAHALPLCPVIIKPQHWVVEDVGFTFEQSHRRRAETRRALGEATHRVHLGSRTFVGGILTALFGTLASFPIVMRILFPRLTSQIRRMFGQIVQPPPVTQLRLERAAPTPGPGDGQIGYTVEEMAGIVERILRDIGLTSNFAPLVIFTGHGSSSLNNPHESAYNCGACSGGRGGPNARAFAQMANDLRVRDLLAARGLVLSRDIVFIGAYHNTCDDSMTYFDLDHLPATHKSDFVRASGALDTARARNAHERCRRFESAPLSLTADAALRHVEARSEDLSQARPEYNHATNALCIVGRRSRTRGLFLDRRAFLASYDPTQDDEQQSILLRILQAAIPVCAGISLEYYHSTVDSEGYGCGSKLPHNITSLLGVMTGAASDLRPGLSAQMVEIHEPIRILFIIETTPDAMLSIMDRNEVIAQLCRNNWVQLATLDPHSEKIQLFRNGQFEVYRPESRELAVVDSSIDWYRGWRDHLGFALIRTDEKF